MMGMLLVWVMLNVGFSPSPAEQKLRPLELGQRSGVAVDRTGEILRRGDAGAGHSPRGGHERILQFRAERLTKCAADAAHGDHKGHQQRVEVPHIASLPLSRLTIRNGPSFRRASISDRHIGFAAFSRYCPAGKVNAIRLIPR